MTGLSDFIDGIIKFAYFSFFVMWPLGIWKLVDIVYWVYTHLHWS